MLYSLSIGDQYLFFSATRFHKKKYVFLFLVQLSQVQFSYFKEAKFTYLTVCPQPKSPQTVVVPVVLHIKAESLYQFRISTLKLKVIEESDHIISYSINHTEESWVGHGL